MTEAAEAAGAREAEQPSADSREGPEADGSDGNGPYADPARAIDGTAPGDHVGEAPGDPGDPNSPAGPEDPDAPAGPPRRALYAMGSQGGGPAADRARPARVPGGRALPDAQQLGRALRPLRRSRDHPHRTAIDIESTVRLAAETGFLDAVCRPEQERRWSAVLLVDRSPSMQVWGPLAAELRALLARSTVFRSVEVHLLDPEDPAGPLYGRQPAKAALTFLLTDGTSDVYKRQEPAAPAAVARYGPGRPPPAAGRTGCVRPRGPPERLRRTERGARPGRGRPARAARPAPHRLRPGAVGRTAHPPRRPASDRHGTARRRTGPHPAAPAARHRRGTPHPLPRRLLARVLPPRRPPLRHPPADHPADAAGARRHDAAGRAHPCRRDPPRRPPGTHRPRPRRGRRPDPGPRPGPAATGPTGRARLRLPPRRARTALQRPRRRSGHGCRTSPS